MHSCSKILYDYINMVKIAVCYWGLVRTLREVYPSQKKYVFNPLDECSIEYDTYIHTWIVDKNLVWNRVMKKQNDYDSMDIIEPKSKQIDVQSDFFQTLHREDYYYDGQREWDPQLLNNHLCALESQKRSVELCLASGEEYDYVMFLRPDALINKRLPVERIFREHFVLEPNTIILPNFNHWEGYNDQFAIVPFSLVKEYSHRIDGIAEFRKTQGRIVAEKYVKYVVDRHFKPVFADFHFDLLRPDGNLNGNF